MQLNRVDIREGVADMQMLHRVDVDARLTTQNAGVARSKLIGWRVVDEDRLIVLICQLLAIDVMVDAIGKQRELCRNDRRRIIQTKVELPAVFRRQTGMLRLKRLRGIYLAASWILAMTVALSSNTGDLEVTRPSTTFLPSATYFNGSKPPERSSSFKK